MEKQIRVKVRSRLHNRFDVYKTDVNTGKTEQIAYAENIILDTMWSHPWETTAFSGNSGPLNFLHQIAVGRGTGTLARTRTALFSQIFSVDRTPSFDNYVVNNADGYAYGTIGTRRTESQDVGETYTEIGLKDERGISGSDNRLITHAMLKDMNGNPTTILKTNTEIITFYATLYIYIGSYEYYGGSVYFSSISHDLIAKIANPAASGYISRSIVAYNGLPVRSSILQNPDIANYKTLASACAWNSGTKTLKFSGRYAVGDANGDSATYKSIVGIWLFVHSNLYLELKHPWAKTVSGTPWYPASDVANETMQAGDGIRTAFKTRFPWISAVTVKVDGVAVDSADYTVDNDVPPSIYCDYLFQYDSVVGAAYNPYYLTHGLKSAYLYYSKFEASQDGTTWVVAASGHSTTAAITAAYKNYKYWRTTNTYSYGSSYDICRYLAFDIASEDEIANIIFDSPPGLVTGENVGTGDSSEVDFALDHSPSAGSLVVKLDGVATENYTLDGSLITFNTAPGTDVVITADYKYECIVTVDYTTEVLPKDVNHVFDISIEYVFDEYVDE